MSTTFDLERLLANWMADGPSTMPHGVVTAVADRIATQPQRVTGRVASRLSGAWPSLRLAVTALAIIAVAVVGVVMIPRLPGIGVVPSPAPTVAPTLSPTPTLVPTASPVPTEKPEPTPSDLVAGTHSSTALYPQLSFTVGGDWQVAYDDYHYFALSYQDARASIYVNPSVYPPCRGPDMSQRDPHTAAHLVEALVGAPGYDVTATSITLSGLTGWRIEGSATGGCGTFTAYWGSVVFVDLAPGDIHLIALDTPTGTTILITLEADDPEALALAESVISSFEFAPQPPWTTSSSPSPVPTEELEPTPSDLVAGTHSSTIWQQPVTLNVGDDWRLERETEFFFELSYRGDRARIKLSYRVYPGCSLSGMSPTDPDAAVDLANALLAADGYDVTVTPTALGGLTGWRIEGIYTFGCGTYIVLANWPIVVHRVPGDIHLIALDTGRGHTIVIDWSADDTDALALVEDVISSFEFAPQP